MSSINTVLFAQTPHAGHRLSRRQPGGLFRALVLWINRAEQRRALAELDDDQLRDIGKTRREALFESRKPFWES
jgi:uncharacterized protein YjiS (DUF1127 family)